MKSIKHLGVACFKGVIHMKKKPLPPYAKGIPNNQNCIFICTGSKAWDKAKLTHWHKRYKKTLLPLKQDISGFNWKFVLNRDVLIFSHGILDTYERLVQLSRVLLLNGARSVDLCVPEYKMSRFVKGAGYVAT